MNSSTSSFRISDALRRRLELTAKHLKKGKNWIVIQALEEYLEKIHGTALAAEARRQSILASSATTTDEEYWARLADDTAWR